MRWTSVKTFAHMNLFFFLRQDFKALLAGRIVRDMINESIVLVESFVCGIFFQ
jgi:hypothetical protein